MNRRGSGGGTSRATTTTPDLGLTSKSSEWRGTQHDPGTPVTQAFEGGTRGVDEDDGEISLFFFKKEIEMRVKTRSAEMFLKHVSVFPFDLRGGLLMYHHGCLRPIAKTPFSQGL